MPLIDKPLPELELYFGTNPKPADFDTYWEESLEELDATAPNSVLTPNNSISSTATECFDLTFTGVGGAQVYAKYLRPKGATNCPTVIMFHGYSQHSGEWQDKLSYIAEGFCVIAMDCRGQGGLSEDTSSVKGTTLRGQIIRGLEDPDPKNLFFRSIFLDTVQLARVAMAFPEIDADRIGVTGGSQGGGLSLVCAALEPRIKLAAPIFPFLSDYQRVWEMDLAKAAYEEISYYLRQRDPNHKNIKAMFEKLGYIDVQHFADRIKAETLMFTGLMDDIAPPSAQFAIYNKIQSSKDIVIYPDFGHENLPGSGDRIFNFMKKL